MFNIPQISIMQELWRKTQGDGRICVAVLDGLVDKNHPCFEGANLTRLSTLVEGEATAQGAMSKHGTHVTSVIFGQHGSPVKGIAPLCKGLIIPIFADGGRNLSQLDLSRAIEQAVNAGAHIINISGGQLTDFGEAEDLLERSVQLCQKSNVLVVAAVGNDGCACLHIPAALPSVLAVGAMDSQGKPIEYSNWGKHYQTQGILAPGENILGAKPGGGVVRLSGTSFATPIVSGVAALLLSLQLQQGELPDPQKVRAAILGSATPCAPPGGTERDYRCLVGRLNISGAIDLLQGGSMSEQFETVNPSGCGCDTANQVAVGVEGKQKEPQPEGTNSSAEMVASSPSFLEVSSFSPPMDLAASQKNLSGLGDLGMASSDMINSNNTNQAANYITASQPAETATGDLVFALGVVGYDFGTEARRDSFKQLMPNVLFPDAAAGVSPANPYDARQMVDYLAQRRSEAKSLIWTLNLELTPIYAIEPVGPFASNVYEALHQALSGEVLPENDDNFVQQVSIPGRLTGRTIKLFSGQIVPILALENERGIYSWNTNRLINTAVANVPEDRQDQLTSTLDSFLQRIYYDYRNLGTTSQDRALNFAATQLVQSVSTFSQAIDLGMQLDSISVEKSPYCRIDSDCWDIKLKFFNPSNNREARRVFRFTVDVSDDYPVLLGLLRNWASPY